MTNRIEEFYYKKSSKALYRIYLGLNNYSYNERKLAERILSERDFDFENVSKYKDKWELEDLTKDISDEETGIFKSSVKPMFLFMNGIVGLLGFVFFLINLLMDNQLTNLSYSSDTLFKKLGMMLLLIYGLGAIQLSRIRNKRIKERENRITELRSKLTDY